MVRKAAQQSGSILEGAVIGGLSNLLGGKVISAVTSLVGNLASQTNNPCFNDFNWSQAAAAGLLGKYNAGSGIANKLIPKSAGYVSHVVTGQAINNAIVSGL